MSRNWMGVIAVLTMAMSGCSKQESPPPAGTAAPTPPAAQPAMSQTMPGMAHEAAPQPQPEASPTPAPERNAKCPVTGDDITAASDFVEKDGKRVYVCCGGCRKTVEKDFEKYYKIAYGK